MNTLTLLGSRAMTVVNEVLVLEGQLRFFSDWDADIVSRFAEKSVAEYETPISVPVTSGGLRRVLRPVHVQEGVTRRFDYAQLREQQPDLYAAHVVETPPTSPTRLTFKSRKRGTSRTWDAIRSRGWTAAHDVWGPAATPTGLYSAREEAALLYEIRQRCATLRESRATLRTELAGIVVGPRQGMVSVSHGDGIITPSVNPAKRTIDLDVAQLDIELARYITRTPRAESIRWTFVTEKDFSESDLEGDRWAE